MTRSILLFVAACSSAVLLRPAEPPVSAAVLHESRARPDILDEKSQAGIRVVQITTDPKRPSWNVYTEAPVFTPDSRRFIFIREGNYWLCDMADNFGLRQLTDEPGATGGAVTPDGQWMYYLLENQEHTGAKLILKRLSLTRFTREAVLVVKDTLPGTAFRPSQLYELSSIRSDGKRLVTSCFLGDGKTAKAPFGLLVFRLDEPSVQVFPMGPDYCNMHAQYSRSREPGHFRDILVQHNHGSVVDLSGKIVKLVGGDGADLHVIRDDGTDWRDIPIGRDGVEYVQGHQQWRGSMPTVLSAMSIPRGKKRILEGFPIPTTEQTSHCGSKIPGGQSWDITRDIQNPEFWHFSPDSSGMHLVSDTNVFDPATSKLRITLVIGSLSGTVNPLLKLRYLLNTRTSGKDQPMHPHPFFSPDTRRVFFNSDAAGGVPQVWTVTGYTFPE